MLTIQATRAGGPEVLEAVDAPTPSPGPGQVLVRHKAIGLNFIDTYQRSGLYPMRYPAVLGQEAAGVVEAVGEGVSRFKPGDRVAYNAQGAYAEQSLRLSSEFDSALTHAEIPVTLGRTALQPLDSFTCPAVAIELSPLNLNGKVTALSNPEYQDRIVAALAAAVEQWQRDWRQQP